MDSLNNEEEEEEEEEIEFEYTRLNKYEKRKREYKTLDRRNNYKKQRKCILCSFTTNQKIAERMYNFNLFAIDQFKNTPAPVAYEAIATQFNNTCHAFDKEINGHNSIQKITSSDVRHHFTTVTHLQQYNLCAIDSQIEFIQTSLDCLKKRGCWKNPGIKQKDDSFKKCGAITPDHKNWDLYLKLLDKWGKLLETRDKLSKNNSTTPIQLPPQGDDYFCFTEE